MVIRRSISLLYNLIIMIVNNFVIIYGKNSNVLCRYMLGSFMVTRSMVVVSTHGLMVQRTAVTYIVICEKAMAHFVMLTTTCFR